MFRSIMLRFVLPVALAPCVVAYVGLPYIQKLLAEWFRSDVELRAQLVMHSAEEPITDLVENGSEARLRAYLAKIATDERLLAILVCRPNGSTIFKSERTPMAISCEAEGGGVNPARSRIMQLPSGSVQVSRFDFDAAEPKAFRVLMLHDLSFVDRRGIRCRYYRRCGRCLPKRRRNSAWRSIIARTGLRRRCSRWCAAS
jgi:hypothetical protein